MKIILLEKLPNLGDAGAIVNVKPGYARNFLLPKSKAQPATSENIQKVEADVANLKAKDVGKLEQAKNLATQIQEATISISSTAGEEGQLFGSVGTREITEALEKVGITIERRQLALEDGSFRMLGEHSVKAILHAEVSLDFTITIVAE